MNTFLKLILVCLFTVNPCKAKENLFSKIVHGHNDAFLDHKETIVFERKNDDEMEFFLNKHNISVSDATILKKINYFDDNHKQLIVHWVGDGTNVIICLTRDPAPSFYSNVKSVRPSGVYISYDNGNSYENKTDLFKTADGSYAILKKFYVHPKYNTHIVFADVSNNLLYTTTNHGKEIQRKELHFTPTEITFNKFQPSVIVILDKNDYMHKLWVSEDFGDSFKQIDYFVNGLNWIDEDTASTLVVHKMKLNGMSTILYSSNILPDKRDKLFHIYTKHAEDFYVKGDYLFTTKTSPKGYLELYVSYKLGKKVKCIFDTNLWKGNFYIVDVTNDRALVAVSHSNITSHLYVSENLNTNKENVHFTLSLEDVLCHFPNSSWNITQELFVDVYKVKGVIGIYIASRVLIKPKDNDLGPQHVGSVITFDHGRSWKLINAPEKNIEGQPTSCFVHNKCSLHMSNMFSKLYRTNGIISSKSAPGFIMAAGVMGTSLKGHYRIYVSNDAGFTWKQVLPLQYHFNMGNFGGILTTVKNFNYLLYSTDEGENWKQVVFHDEVMHVHSLMTEPGENTTTFSIFGFLLQKQQWVTIKLDLINIFDRNCSENDYKVSSLIQNDGNRSYISCILGQNLTYKRRIPQTNCLNHLDFDAFISSTPCECDFYDFECDFGFVRSKQSDHCIRNAIAWQDPYKVPENCKQGEFYRRTKGYRKIPGDVCMAGYEDYYLPEEIPCPVNETQDFFLSCHEWNRIRRFNLATKTMEVLPVKPLRGVETLEFDMKNNCLYWADNHFKILARQCSDDTKPEILVATNLGDIKDIAFDWISQTLYFVDGERLKIELIRTDINHSKRMRKTILDRNVLRKPDKIALHPKRGYMFWTDRDSEGFVINRADLDGKNIKKLFGKPVIRKWLMSITIDYIAERIYWIDSDLYSFASGDLHGGHFRDVTFPNGKNHLAADVAVYKDRMYWSDWSSRAISSIDKDTFEGYDVLHRGVLGISNLKLFAQGNRVGSNACINSTCKYICVGKPTEERSACLCPDGMTYENGDCRPDNVTALEVHGIDDCGDGADELRCSNHSCSPNYFQCGDGKCINDSLRCDANADCFDLTDELNCPIKNCPEDQFSCDSRRCIFSHKKCNQAFDCNDDSDEKNCTYECRSHDDFRCNELTCIPADWHCDGDNDCGDGSDELNCPGKDCTENQFVCDNGKCIPAHWQCDFLDHCGDGSDEKNCAYVCGSNEFRCNKTTCIPIHWHCDGKIDCDDGSDELKCPENNYCREKQFTCDDGKCIPFYWKCDGEADCGDGSDEKNCVFQCRRNEFRCKKSTCIPALWRCDGENDCGDNSDEINCKNESCQFDHFSCGPPLNWCIYTSWVCDGQNDCPDGIDEANCTTSGSENIPTSISPTTQIAL